MYLLLTGQNLPHRYNTPARTVFFNRLGATAPGSAWENSDQRTAAAGSSLQSLPFSAAAPSYATCQLDSVYFQGHKAPARQKTQQLHPFSLAWMLPNCPKVGARSWAQDRASWAETTVPPSFLNDGGTKWLGAVEPSGALLDWRAGQCLQFPPRSGHLPAKRQRPPGCPS